MDELMLISQGICEGCVAWIREGHVTGGLCVDVSVDLGVARQIGGRPWKWFCVLGCEAA